MTHDLYGNLVCGANDSDIEGINDFVHGFIAFHPKATKILKTAKTSECALVHAYCAWLMMMIESPAGPKLARPFMDKALALGSHTSPREQAIIASAQAFVNGDIPRVIRLCEDIVAENPRDMATLKMAQYHTFNIGDFPAMLRVATKALNGAEDIAYTHGMLSFGYEECHLLDHAQAAAERALEIDESEPWAHHTLAHVHLTRGHIDQGVSFMEGVSSHWTGLNSFMHSHNWWHVGLFYISQGRNDDLLNAYDTHVWGLSKDYSQDQINAVSLLARMEFAGVNVGDRWQDVADHVAKRGADTVSPFLTLQYLYALDRTQHSHGEALLKAIEDRAQDDTRHDHAVWRDVVIWAAHGIAAHAAHDWEDAIRFMGKALPRLSEAGGSHAQRDLFEQIYLDALMQANRMPQAQQVLEMRRTFDPSGVPLNKMLARVYDKNGLPDLADTARARII
ncbi:MAG: tetratricopeptide repeat protein [Paracoccaceae bacterium]